MLVRAPTVTGAQIAAQHARRTRPTRPRPACTSPTTAAPGSDQRALADRGQRRQVAIDDRAREAPAQLRQAGVQRRGVGQRTVDDGDRRRDRRHRARTPSGADQAQLAQARRLLDRRSGSGSRSRRRRSPSPGPLAARLLTRLVQPLERQVAERIGADELRGSPRRCATRRSAPRASACRCRSGRARSSAAS